MPQVEQTRSSASSMTLSIMRTQNAPVGHTHPYAHQHSSTPRKHRLSPPRTNKSNEPTSAGPGPIRRALSARSQGPRDHPGFRQEITTNQAQVTYSNQRPQVHSLAPLPAQSPLHVVDQAFTVYTDRLQNSLNEFRSVCTTLVVQEQEERRRVHNLCLKVMRERDLARQKVDALMAETGADFSKGPQRKRSREEMAIPHPPAPRQGDRAPRPISTPNLKVSGFLETSLSPVVSPDSGPFDLPLSPLIRPASDRSSSPTVVNTSLVPPHGTSPLCHTSGSLSPLNLPIGKVYSERQEQTPPIKRRKSCDAASTRPTTSSGSETCGTGLPPAVLRKAKKDHATTLNTTATAPVPPPVNFQHVDLMYVVSKSRGGRLVCRACLLESSKSRLLSPSPLCLEPSSCLPSPTSPPTSSSQPKLRAPSTPEAPATPDVTGIFEPTSFPAGTPWHELRDHCVREHPRECEDVNKLHPSQVWELRRRLGIR